MEAKDAVEAPARGAEIELLYRSHYDLMLAIARRKFHIPHEDAENLVNEVFLTYLGSARVHNARSWLIGGICNAAKQYQRVHDRRDELDAEMPERQTEIEGFDDDLLTRITVRETISRLHDKCQKTLRLHYWEGRSAPELATELDTTSRYAEKLIHKCLKRASQIYRQLTGRKQ